MAGPIHEMTVRLGDDERSPMREYKVRYTWSRGTPAVRYQRNGDPGWPGDPDEATIVSITPDPETNVSVWAPKQALDDELDSILDQVYENHDDGPDDDRSYDGEDDHLFSDQRDD